MHEVVFPVVNNDHASRFGVSGTRFLLIIVNTVTFCQGCK